MSSTHTYTVASDRLGPNPAHIVDDVRTFIDREVGFTGTVTRWVLIEKPGDTVIIDQHGNTVDWSLAADENSALGRVVRHYLDPENGLFTPDHHATSAGAF